MGCLPPFSTGAGFRNHPPYDAVPSDSTFRPAACPQPTPRPWPRRSGHPAAQPGPRASPGGNRRVLSRRSELRATKDGWLVVDLALWKMMELVSWDDDIPNIWKNKRWSKPPTRWCFFDVHGISWGFQRNLDGKIFDQWKCSMGKSSMEVFQWDLMGFEQQMVRMFSSWDDGRRWNSAGSCWSEAIGREGEGGLKSVWKWKSDLQEEGGHFCGARKCVC